MWLCSKQSSFFPFMHCPLVANQKTGGPLRLKIRKLSILPGKFGWWNFLLFNLLSHISLCRIEIWTRITYESTELWRLQISCLTKCSLIFDAFLAFDGNILAVGGATRNLTGHWKTNCYQVNPFTHFVIGWRGSGAYHFIWLWSPFLATKPSQVKLKNNYFLVKKQTFVCE